jgi:hypothetical protein
VAVYAAVGVAGKLLCTGFTNCCALGFLQFICLSFPKVLFVGVVSLPNYARLKGHQITGNKGVLFFFGIPTAAKMKNNIKLNYSFR